MNQIKDTLDEITEKVDVLSEILVSANKGAIKSILAVDVMQTLILAEDKLKNEKIDEQEKLNLCEMLTLLFMQVTKFETIGGKI